MIWMTHRRLDWALRVHGTELAAWPAAERMAALTLMRRCGRARQVMADALAQEEEAPADQVLLASMQCRLGRRLMAPSPARPAMRWGALAASALAGLYLGFAGVDTEQPDVFATVQAIAIYAAL